MAQPVLREPAHSAAVTQQQQQQQQSSSSSSASPQGPGLRQQMRTIVTMYELLTTVYFLLIEQGASTSAVATRATLNTHVGKLRGIVLGEDEQQKAANAVSAAERRAASARPQQHEPSSSLRRPAAGLLANLRPEHAQRIQRLAAVERILAVRNRSTAGSTSSSSPLPTIAEVADAIHTLNELLVGLMQRAQRHSQQQATIRKLMRDVRSYDDGMVQYIRRLAVLRDRCDRLVTLGREEEQAMRRATESPLAYDDILRYARTLSQTTTAPPGFKFKMPLDDGAEVNGGAEGDGDKQGKTARKSRLLDDEAAEEEEGGSGAGRGGDVIAAIPPYLQDKLPFPSTDAMRRGAGEVRPPTWAMFQQGMLQANDDGERDRDDMESDMDLDRPVVAERRAGHRPPPVAEPAPADDDDDGFGLDLN